MTKDALKPLQILVVLSIVLLALVGWFLYDDPKASPPKTNTLENLGGDFTLQSADGPVSLHDFKGKAVAIYIGYASCPDVCPTALAIMRQAFVNLPEAYQDRVHGIFISVDPERDTPEKLKTYTAFFSPKFTGLTGTKEEIDTVVDQYGAFYRMVKLENSNMGYAVDHSSRIYFISPDGQLMTTLSHTAPPKAVEDVLIKALQ
jgi:protein SCO1/2